MPPLSNLAVRDLETLVHPYTNLATLRETGPLIIERAQGVFVYDTEGKAYIEGMAGLWCTALGYGNEELVEAAAAQMRKLSFGHLFTAKSHDPAIELAERLKEIAPVPTSKVFFCSSGSEANDSQIKLVWYMNNALGRPRKKKIISRRKAYHGVTVAAASLTGLPNNHLDFDLPLAGILHAACPHHYGFARLGTMFGCTALGFEPHSISVAKALTSAYVPMAALTVPEVAYQAMLDESRKIGTFGHGFTYSGHPVAAAVALKALDIYARERIAEQAARKAPHFQARLAALGKHPLVGEARGLGLVGGVELVADKKTKRSFDAKAGVAPRAVRYAEEEGLIVRFLMGDIVSICPPLIITPAEIDELFDRLGRALDRTLDWVKHERLIDG